MTNQNLRTEIQNFLLARARAFRFPVVNYTAADDGENQANLIPDTFARASSVNANEIGCNFSVDERNGRSRVRRRENWSFRLHVAAQEEVSFLEFEDSMRGTNFKTQDGQRVFIDLAGAAYTHPVTNDASTGSSAVFTFEAEIGRD